MAAQSNPAPAAGDGEIPEQTSDRAAALAAELLDAVEGGSSARLLEVLSRIAQIDLARGQGGENNRSRCEQPLSSQEWERLELLRALAVQLRLDLHAMLMHIYQRVEASRGYLDLVRHLAGREANGQCGIWNALPGMKPAAGSAFNFTACHGREIGGTMPDGEK